MKKRSIGSMLGATALLAFCALGMAHAVRAGVASMLYYGSRYVGLGWDADRIERFCQRAHALYPFDYYACIWAGKTAFYGVENADGSPVTRRLDRADLWTERGLRLNPFNSELAQSRTEVLFLAAPDAAVELWERYVAFAFWNRYHLSFMFDLYVSNGRLEAAEEILYWLKGSRWYVESERTLNEAVRQRR